MASPLGKVGSLQVKTGDDGSSMAVGIAETAGIVSEGLSLSTWGAAFVLANNLYKVDLPVDVPLAEGEGRRGQRPFMLELGAGTGLVGLSAAVLWRAAVVLTDLPLILPGIEANVTLNATLLAQHGASASSGALDWTDPTHIRSATGITASVADGHRATVILAADTIYSDEHPELLVATVSAWLAREPWARVVVSYPLRMAYIDHIRDFWERMEAAGLACVQEGREEGIEEWNELAATPFEWCVWAWRE